MRSRFAAIVALPFPANIDDMPQSLLRVSVRRVECPGRLGDRGMGRSVARGILAHLEIVRADYCLAPFVAGLSGQPHDYRISRRAALREDAPAAMQPFNWFA